MGLPEQQDEAVSINWETLSEALGMDEEELRRIQKEGAECPSCGEHLENLGEVLDHECGDVDGDGGG